MEVAGTKILSCDNEARMLGVSGGLALSTSEQRQARKMFLVHAT